MAGIWPSTAGVARADLELSSHYAVLDALMRAGVMMRLQNDSYMRCHLTEQQSA